MYTEKEVEQMASNAAKTSEDVKKGTDRANSVLISVMYQEGVHVLHLDDFTGIAFAAYCAASKQVEAGDMEEAEKIMRAKIQDLLYFAPRVYSIPENERMKQRLYAFLHTHDKNPEELEAEHQEQVKRYEEQEQQKRQKEA